MIDLLIVAAIGMVLLATFNLISLRATLSKENRRRVLEKSEAQEEKGENIIEFGRLKADMIRYRQNREAFLGMKMDYLPTKEKIDKLLETLQAEISKTKSNQWKLVEIDIAILEEMRERLTLGTLVVHDFPIKTESEKAQSASDAMPIWTVLTYSILSSTFGLLLIAGVFLLALFSQDESMLDIISLVVLVLVPGLHYSNSFAENVLRRSRKRDVREAAHFSQVIIIISMLMIVALLALELIL